MFGIPELLRRGGLDLLVTDLFARTTFVGADMLGLDELDEAFLSGNTLEMDLSDSMAAIGLFVIGSPGEGR